MPDPDTTDYDRDSDEAGSARLAIIDALEARTLDPERSSRVRVDDLVDEVPQGRLTVRGALQDLARAGWVGIFKRPTHPGAYVKPTAAFDAGARRNAREA